MASLVNQDGNVISGTVNTDEDASALASYLDGPRTDPYYKPARSLSGTDESVHNIYEQLFDIVNKPQKYDANQINDRLAEIEEFVYHHGSFDGNYNADLADRNSNVYKYWRNYRSNKKRWDAKRDKMVAKKKQELDAKGMKITDEMNSKEKREMSKKRSQVCREVYRKYNRGSLSQQIYYLMKKAEEIKEKKEWGSDSESSDDGVAAAVMKKPSPTELKKREEQAKKEASRRKKLAPLLAKMKLKKSSAKPQAKPMAAVAMTESESESEPSVKEMFGDKWIGPYMSKSKGIKYWVRARDKLGVFVDSKTGKLTERNIRKTEEHKAKKAAKKGGRRKTRKKKGGVKVKKTKKKKKIKTQAQKDKENKRRRFLRSLKKDSFRADAGQITRPEWSNPNELEQAIQETYMDEAERARLTERVGLERVKSDDEDEDDKFPNLSFIQKDDLTKGDVAREAVGDQIGGKRRRKTRKMKGGHHLYKRLGVSKYASQKQIKKAYNKLKKKKKLTKKVKYAYKILSKKKSRKKYNAKYKKMKNKKRTKRRNKGGMSSMVIKGQSFPSGFMPIFDIPDTSSLNAPAWMSQL